VRYTNLTLFKNGIAAPLPTLLDEPYKSLAVSATNIKTDLNLLRGATYLPNLSDFQAITVSTAAGGKKAFLTSRLDAVFAASTNTVLTDPATRTSLLSVVQSDPAVPGTESARIAQLRLLIGAMPNSGSTGSQSNTDKVAQLTTFKQVSDFVLSFIGSVESRMKSVEVEMRKQIPLYASIVGTIENQGIVLPPSGAVLGAYAQTDSTRGVWKAPANIGLNYVAAPLALLSDEQQESMNVDTNGKSINAIRAFTGKGTLVWGARTLNATSNEWRYVAVRRFFIMVEESVKKATSQFVFESNDANTWVKVRAMIENFLTLQWRAGALAGVKPEQAFFVRVGLGQTMTALDVLEGRMIVEIGMAVVRPAEYIVLRFSHKMQES